MTLRQRIERLARWALYDAPHIEQVVDALDQALEETADESWQPLTPDTVLPTGNQLEFWDPTAPEPERVTLAAWSGAERGWYPSDCTHYRVLRGPEEM